MDRPVFDFVEQAYLAGDKGDMLLVVHRGIDGEVVAALSTNMPMGKEETESALARVLQPLQDTALAMLNVL